MALNRLQLESLHRDLGAVFGEFAGWSVPMQYTSVIEEHMAVRESCGVFDISHMGRLRVRGPDAVELLERVYTKRVSKTREGYLSGPTLALNEYARVKDDEMLYKITDEEWLVVPNAVAKDKMISHLRGVAEGLGLRVSIEDLTGDYVMLAIQGPRSIDVLRSIGAGWVDSLKPLEFELDASLGPVKAFLVSRSGWTGEDGVEVWLKPSEAARLYKLLIERGVKPAGIASRDTLRMEMGFVLNGNEYGEDPTKFPCAYSLRYGMGAIDWGKRGFIGEEALRACRREGARWIRVGLVVKKKYARTIPRPGYKVYVEGVEAGWVTSGSFSPVLSRGIAQAYIDSRYALIGETVEVDIRGRLIEAKIVDFPFIRRG